MSLIEHLDELRSRIIVAAIAIGLAAVAGFFLAEPVHVRVARWVADYWTDGRVGLVVGATAPDELLRLRARVAGPAFLVPGVGAQGGDLETSVATASGAWAPGIVSVSRAVAEASSGADWQEAAGAAASALRLRMQEAVLHSTASAAHAADSGGS